jgi:hypothetical protein
MRVSVQIGTYNVLVENILEAAAVIQHNLFKEPTTFSPQGLHCDGLLAFAQSQES